MSRLIRVSLGIAFAATLAATSSALADGEATVAPIDASQAYSNATPRTCPYVNQDADAKVAATGGSSDALPGSSGDSNSGSIR